MASAVQKKSNMSNASKSVKTEQNVEKGDLLDRFHKNKPVCYIRPTTPNPRPDGIDVLRPQPKIYLDYNLSQTDIKLDAGETKIHLQQTEGTYVRPPPGYVFEEPAPPPKKKKRPKYSSAGPPVWEFIDEKWRRAVDAKQAGYIEQLFKRRAERIRKEALKIRGLHRLLYLEYAGPIWFQELSPKQLNTIDNLKFCIDKDLRKKTIINTQENVATLGLVLRPNHNHVRKALNHCCACPVEFLLVLYQLINPKRVNYSMNDKLILSAVVHLTMKETLKEMHIRIPSPPRNKKQRTSSKPEKKKYRRFNSPYLVPYTFQKPPRKHTGIYRNTKGQYPESRYFAYINELRAEQEQAELDALSGKSTKSESISYENAETQSGKGDIGKTMKSFAKKMVKKKASPQNNKDAASKSLSISSKEQELLDELETAQDMYNELIPDGVAPKLLKPSIYIPCDDGLAKTAEEKPPEERKNLELSIEVKITTEYDDNEDPINKRCQCTIIFEETTDSSEEESCTCHSETRDRMASTCFEDRAIGKSKEDLHKPIPICQLPKTTDKPDAATVVHPECPKICTSYDDIAIPSVQEGKVISVVTDDAECKCKAEVQRIIDTSVCQCDKCLEYRRLQKKPPHIITDTKINEEEEPFFAIGGVKLKKTCDCLKKYYEKVKRYEAFKARYEAQRLLKSDEQQFVIGGVYRDAEGKPQYIISGVTPKSVCECQEIVKAEEEAEKRKKERMPKIPMGRLKYIISGVRETPEGNVYQVSGVVPVDDCDCMKIYKTFTKKHTPCMSAYEEYMEKVKIEIDEYMKDLEEDERYKVKEPEESPEPSETEICVCNGPQKPETSNSICENPDCSYRQQMPETSDSICENPDCPYRQQMAETSESICENPDCPFRQQMAETSESICENPDCPYRQQMAETSDSVCENPDCPYRQQMPETSDSICENPDCPYKQQIAETSDSICENPDCPYRQQMSENSGSICENPDCPYREQTSQQFSICENPDCPYQTQQASYVCPSPNCPSNQMQQQSAYVCPSPNCPSNKFQAAALDSSDNICENPDCPHQKPEPTCCAETPEEVETNLYITLEINKDPNAIEEEKQECICGANSDPCGTKKCTCKKVDVSKCPCGDDAKKTKKKVDLKRFIILENISCNIKKQRKIIKQVLAQLAEDDYPLAKLPDVHKLPHFELWMLWRCGRYWTIDEKFGPYIKMSRDYWGHTDMCQRKTDVAQLPFSVEEGKKYTWFNADYVRGMVSKEIEMYYRKVKQCSIDDGREFFPTIFDYEFPTATFRHTFFAYTASKEEDIYAFRPWQQHEIKDLSKRKTCY